VIELERRATALATSGKPAPAPLPTPPIPPSGSPSASAPGDDRAPSAAPDQTSDEAPADANVVDTVLAAAAEALGLDPADATTNPDVIAHALDQSVATLDLILSTAGTPTVSVIPAPPTAQDILTDEVAAALADADGLEELGATTGGYPNGYLPLETLTELSWSAGEYLRPDAAVELEHLNTAFRAEFGHDLKVLDSYRTFADQVTTRQTRGNLAATPGMSNHGWGVAVDLGPSTDTFGTPEHDWMVTNAPKFGWDQPSWARINGTKPEPWHWEYTAVAESNAD
jgi:hypothetical protein